MPESDTEQPFREWLEEKLESAKDQYHSENGGEFGSDEFQHGKCTAYKEVLKRYEDTASDE